MLGQGSHRWATIDAVAAAKQRAAGMTFAAIAKAHGCSRRTVHRRLAELGAVKPYRYHDGTREA